MPVLDIEYGVHNKIGKPPTLVVKYVIQNGRAVDVRQWLCFSHPVGSFPYQKAFQYWMAAGGKSPVPVSAREAFERYHELRRPVTAYIAKEDKYYVIKSLKYDQARANA